MKPSFQNTLLCFICGKDFTHLNRNILIAFDTKFNQSRDNF